MTITLIRAIFYLSAAYDGAIGLVFLFAPSYVFEFFKVPPPNHPGYVSFPAALLLIFAVMFLAIARKPVENRILIPYGILLKIAYCGVSCAYWYLGNLPWMWQPFAVCDFIMLITYLWAYNRVIAAEAAENSPSGDTGASAAV